MAWAQPSHDAQAEVQSAALRQEVAQLRDLFQRRLLEDKAKNKLYDELYEQLRIARNGLSEQLLVPLFRELLLIVDRVKNLSKPGDAIMESVGTELLDLLERHDVTAVATVGMFDPAIHDAVRTEPCGERPPGTILEVLRRGYVLGGRLLRAERVVVATGSDAAEPCPKDVDDVQLRLGDQGQQ